MYVGIYLSSYVCTANISQSNISQDILMMKHPHWENYSNFTEFPGEEIFTPGN